MTAVLSIVAHLLLGGAFVAFAIRNTKAIARLSGVLAGRKIPQPELAARFGVGLQVAGGVLTVLAPFVPVAGVVGGLVMIVFLILATTLFHPYWEYSGSERTPHVTAWLMNTGLSGAFLLVIAQGL